MKLNHMIKNLSFKIFQNIQEYTYQKRTARTRCHILARLKHFSKTTKIDLVLKTETLTMKSQNDHRKDKGSGRSVFPHQTQSLLSQLRRESLPFGRFKRQKMNE